MDTSSRVQADLDDSYSDYEFVAEFYDHVVPYRDRADVTFYRQKAEEFGGPILELGCGTGRVLIPTARSGAKITGVDLSDHMLTVCRERLKHENHDVQSNVQLIQADMTQVRIGRKFKLVTSPFRAFQHLLTVDAQIKALQNAYAHLRPGGYLALDLFNPSLSALTDTNFGVEFGEEPEFTLPDGRKVLRKHSILNRDHIHQISTVELIYYVTYPDGRSERMVHRFEMRHLFRFEMEHLLARCGFKIAEVYSDFDLTPYGEKYPGELIFIAQRPA